MKRLYIVCIIHTLSTRDQRKNNVVILFINCANKTRGHRGLNKNLERLGCFFFLHTFLLTRGTRFSYTLQVDILKNPIECYSKLFARQ